ncbi:hypothetical protein DUZ99_16330 [Xylanibacillus composti]|uniref:DUF5668 domain-containing protein n=1 Tax=Xylanibacillus composti TaxID=1572762 RepID=A0A8J4H3T2_9BACL|nr:hypothetical protein [Xylanibacillus composti]MDT9726549.1 hypothetical protein [Xylanibacillus composti]GIQ68967.1 hypothetical protein XYCOK13_17910 [Xylanibacillus composti]
MRKWRVGSFTMGFSLLLLGIVCLTTAWRGKEAFDALFQWWPLLFILLGVEILAALVLAKEEHPRLHYDVLSLLFVPFLIMLGMGFTLLTYTGLAEELRDSIRAVRYTETLPAWEQNLPPEVTTVVVQAPHTQVITDRIADSKLHLLGTYWYDSAIPQSEQPVLTTDIYETSVIGDKLYLTMNPLPQQHNWFGSPGHRKLTVIVPEQVHVEIR